MVEPPRLYPLFLKLEGRDVLVVGAGPAAERKIGDLAAAGARVRVVAPRATPAVQKLASEGKIAWSARRFAPQDLRRAWLVVLATGDASLQRKVARDALARRTFVLSVDDPANGSAYSGAVLRRGGFAIAISSSGETPALSRLLRELLEQALPDETWVEAALELRRRWWAEGTPMRSRFDDLVRSFSARAVKPAKPAVIRRRGPAASATSARKGSRPRARRLRPR